jgi:hypothetical protein
LGRAEATVEGRRREISSGGLLCQDVRRVQEEEQRSWWSERSISLSMMSDG